MRIMKIKKMTLQPGRPKIAIPITGRSHEEIVDQVAAAIKGPCDILEWRADYFFGELNNLEERIENTAAHMEMIRILDDIDYRTGGMPLIFTIRGHVHGGKVAIKRHHAYDLASLAAQSGLVDFVDMELLDDDDTYDEAQVLRQIEEIHSMGARVILSYHDYEGMPTVEQIGNIAGLMRSMGADMVKIAGTVKEREEALEMLKMAAYLTEGEQDPVILVAMGDKGLISRVAGGKYGSCISFAKGAEKTAEGQPDAETLSKLLDEYYGE